MNAVTIRLLGVRDAVLPSGANTIVKPLLLPNDTYDNGIVALLCLIHLARWYRERNIINLTAYYNLTACMDESMILQA